MITNLGDELGAPGAGIQLRRIAEQMGEHLREPHCLAELMRLTAPRRNQIEYSMNSSSRIHCGAGRDRVPLEQRLCNLERLAPKHRPITPMLVKLFARVQLRPDFHGSLRPRPPSGKIPGIK